MRSILRSLPPRVGQLVWRREGLLRAFRRARRAAVYVFELGGRSASSQPPWAVDWHQWKPARERSFDRQPMCATCGLRGVPPGTLHRALDRDESDAAHSIVADSEEGGAGWVLGVSAHGKLLGVSEAAAQEKEQAST
jgi:hypothetical protein